MKKEIAIIGLGKMGRGLVLNLMEQGWTVFGIDPSEEAVSELVGEGMVALESHADMLAAMSAPRLVWVMVPSGDIVESVLLGSDDSMLNTLEAGDIVIDGGNSQYTHSVRRGAAFAEKDIEFVDAGVSGGPGGARNGACIMIGGSSETFAQIEELFADLSVDEGYAHFEGAGAGHFVKMVHNGIEYGIMQAIAEGFAVMKASEFAPDLEKVAHVYQHGSVIESSLVGWMKQAFTDWGQDLDTISGEVSASGEGLWTVEAAERLGIPVDVIKRSLDFRTESQGNPSYMGKLVSALRGQFGGHPVYEKGKEPKK
jgi:6-phosphogluconate dehydrogenase